MRAVQSGSFDASRTDFRAYRARQRVAAEQALDDMAADAQRLGLYDVAPEEMSEALRNARGKSER